MKLQNQKITRRGFVVGTVAAATTVAMPAIAKTKKIKVDTDKDIITNTSESSFSSTTGMSTENIVVDEAKVEEKPVEKKSKKSKFFKKEKKDA